jgi:fumarylacetoacetase
MCAGAKLNPLLAAGPGDWRALRHRLSEMLSADVPESSRCHDCLRTLASVELLLPVDVGDYTDFYASIYHATNIGRLFRPDNPLLPNYKHVPIAYHGRASSIVRSGTAVRRPLGQRRPPDADAPSFGPSRSLDYELEVGLIVGTGNEAGERIAIDEADAHIFGVALVNDWSARDVQAWEYQPLGPFLSKSFATSVSPWIVTLDALAPFRAPAFERAADDPQPLSYLIDDEDQLHGGIDLRLEVLLRTELMRRDGAEPVRVSRQSFLDMYWTPAQMLTHHASNGCPLRPGDLLASGTVSGPDKDAAGCLLEMTRRGERPLELPGGETRAFLEDGDEVILRGYCEAPGRRRIGLGACSGIVEPARL